MFDEGAPGGGGLFEAIFPIFFGVVFVLVIGMFVLTIYKGVRQWKNNNNSPVVTRAARVVGKRQQVSTSNTPASGGAPSSSSTSTTYFVTFQLSNTNERHELPVNSRYYGQLVEGDEGQLTFQGTRFKGFDPSAEALPYPTESSDY